LRLVEDLAGRIAAAVQNALLFQQQRSIAETLQRSLLPPGLPTIPGVGVAVRYRPASGGQVGGDFYDVVTVRERCWGVLVGDVSGKGVTAAALTGVARHTVRAGARHNLAPAEVLSWVHDAMADHAAQSNGQFCTAVYGVLDGTGERPGSFRFRFSLGGHPRPIHVPCGAKPALVGRPGTLLGALSQPRVHESELLLQPGDQLILYTDGATDVAGPTYLDDDHLLELVEQHLDSNAEGTVTAVEDALVRRHMGAPRRDDIALLVLYIGNG
jgi:serine phosphatase RsbU (regulator of sigma subunit)